MKASKRSPGGSELQRAQARLDQARAAAAIKHWSPERAGTDMPAVLAAADAARRRCEEAQQASQRNPATILRIVRSLRLASSLADEQLVHSLIAARVPRRQIEAVLLRWRKTAEAQRVLRAIFADWRARRATTFALVGDPGTGKSATAAAVLSTWARRTIAARTTWYGKDGEVELARGELRVPQLWITDLRWLPAVAYCGMAKWERAALHQPPVLVLDDALREDERDTAAVAELVCERYERAALTILTSNGSTAELLSRLGPRVASRMGEAGRVFVCKHRHRPA